MGCGLNMAGNRGTMDGLPSGTDVMYVTDVQSMDLQKAASYNGGDFMGIAGYKWTRNDAGNVILDKNGFSPQQTPIMQLVIVGVQPLQVALSIPSIGRSHIQHALGIQRWR